MGIKRNKAAEPQWNFMDYAVRSKEHLFSDGRWGEKVNWDIILKQVEKTQQASQMIDINIYPSSLFFTAIDLLEANLLMVDDLFYYLTGIRMTETKIFFEEVRHRLGFWNMDSYKVLNQISEGLLQANVPLVRCLKQEPMWDISLKVIEKSPMSAAWIGSAPVRQDPFPGKSACEYACECYEATEIDQEALAIQIANIHDLTRHYRFYLWSIYGKFTDFSRLLEQFCESHIAQTEYIEPWRHDFGGTRDSLIAKMEKDPELEPWVNRYTHRRTDKSIVEHMFYDDNWHIRNEEEFYNSDNWIRILTIAAVLQEYDEQEDAVVADVSDEDDTILLKLSPYFKDEATVKRFLNSVRLLNDKEIIALVKKYRDAGLCTDASKGLWKVLHDAKLYKPLYTNWNAQLNKR